ncbi:hypothetical protein AX16_007860 [Volvariella volvacea WC 439]|nr:hypothetical protein AX16_007860 [Volvariella volvacea WC 439]
MEVQQLTWLDELQRYYNELGKFITDYQKYGVYEEEGTLLLKRIASTTMTEFLEASEDLYDEITRRKELTPSSERMSHNVQSTLYRSHFPPDRNLARYRLSALPNDWLKTIASFIHFELSRRFPELTGEMRCFLSLTGLIVDFPCPSASNTSEHHPTNERPIAQGVVDGSAQKLAMVSSSTLSGSSELGSSNSSSSSGSSSGPANSSSPPTSYPNSISTSSSHGTQDSIASAIWHPTRLKVKVTTKSQFDQLTEYVNGLKEMPGAATAKGRLATLAIPQFDELVTDIMDEVARRKWKPSEPYLRAEDAMHPKRNEARKMLSALGDDKLRSLASDVQFEMSRRYLSSEDLVQDLLLMSP